MLKKNHRSFLYRMVLVLIGSTGSVFAQDNIGKWEVNAGVGVVEQYHIGAEYYFKGKNSIALSIGYRGIGDSHYYSFTLNHQYSIGSSKKYSGLPTWYIGDRIGMLHSDMLYLQYYNGNSERGTSEELNIAFVVGRKFYFNPHMGVNFDIGGALQILLKEKYPESLSHEYDPVDLLPEMRIQFFYRFLN